MSERNRILDEAIEEIKSITELPGPIPQKVAALIAKVGLEEAERSLVRGVKAEAVCKLESLKERA